MHDQTHSFQGWTYIWIIIRDSKAKRVILHYKYYTSVKLCLGATFGHNSLQGVKIWCKTVLDFCSGMIFPLWEANAYWNTFQKPLVSHGVHTGTWVIPGPPSPEKFTLLPVAFFFSISFPGGMHVWIFRVVTWLCLSCGWSTGYGYIRPNWSGENNSMRFWPPTWAKKFSCSS